MTVADPRTPFEISHGVIHYPFPFSDGQVGSVLLPERLSAEDAERLGEFVRALAQAEEDE